MPESQDNLTGSDIIDGAQNAVIDAVNNVSEMIEKTSEQGRFSQMPSHEAFYLSAEFWVGMAFVLVVIFLSKPVFGAVKKLLIKRRDAIVQELDEAAALKSDAQALLAQYERRFLNAQAEALNIIEKTRHDLDEYTKAQQQSLEKELYDKQNQVQKQIDAEIEKTRSELKEHITQKTIKIVQNRLKNELNSKQQSKLIDASIKNILQKI